MAYTATLEMVKCCFNVFTVAVAVVGMVKDLPVVCVLFGKVYFVSVVLCILANRALQGKEEDRRSKVKKNQEER